MIKQVRLYFWSSHGHSWGCTLASQDDRDQSKSTHKVFYQVDCLDYDSLWMVFQVYQVNILTLMSVQFLHVNRRLNLIEEQQLETFRTTCWLYWRKSTGHQYFPSISMHIHLRSPCAYWFVYLSELLSAERYFQGILSWEKTKEEWFQYFCYPYQRNLLKRGNWCTQYHQEEVHHMVHRMLRRICLFHEVVHGYLQKSWLVLSSE